MQYPQLSETALLRLGHAIIDIERYEVRVDGAVFCLSALELKLLRLLAASPGRAISRKEILDACHSDYVDVTASSVSRRVQRLRRKLGSACDQIITVHGVGYMLRASSQARHTNGDIAVPVGAITGTAGTSVNESTSLWTRFWLPQPPSLSIGTISSPVMGVAISAAAVAALVFIAWHFIGATSSVSDRLVTTIVMHEDDRDSDLKSGAFGVWGGIGSGIDLTKSGHLVGVTGRGPDGAPEPYQSRIHEFEIEWGTDGHPTALVHRRASPLWDQTRRPMTGQAHFFASDAAARRFDPESVRESPTGTLFIADEYGPSVAEFDVDGHLLREFQIPKTFRVGHPAGRTADEHKLNRSGRAMHRGFASLALSPDGRRLFTTTEQPLLQDHGEQGDWLRILEIELASNSTRQRAYRLEQKGNRVEEMTSLPNGDLLVLEQRPQTGGRQAYLKLRRVVLNGADDISSITSLDHSLLSKLNPVSISEMADIATMLKKSGWNFRWPVQSLCLLPQIHKDYLRVVMATDNRSEVDAPTYVFVFSLPIGYE